MKKGGAKKAMPGGGMLYKKAGGTKYKKPAKATW